MPGRRVFYLHNPSGDIGHAVHILRLLAALEARGGRNLIFLRAPSSYPRGCFARYGRVVRLAPRPSAASGRAISEALKKFRPEAVITEFFPFGRGECCRELSPVLSAARSRGAKLIASVPMPYFSVPEKSLLSACALYDRILIHSPEEADLPYMAKAIRLERRISSRTFLSVFGALKGKTVFTGYLLPPALNCAGRKENFILVTRGGGSTSARLLEAAIGAAPAIGLPLLVTAGPSSTASEMKRLRRLAAGSGGSVKVIKTSTDMPGLISRAALCISTAGGSVYEMLAMRKKMVLAPYCGTGGREHSDQLARAWLMRDLAAAELLLPTGITAENIAAAVQRRLGAPLKVSPRVKPAWFRGAPRSAAIIDRL